MYFYNDGRKVLYIEIIYPSPKKCTVDNYDINIERHTSDISWYRPILSLLIIMNESSVSTCSHKNHSIHSCRWIHLLQYPCDAFQCNHKEMFIMNSSVIVIITFVYPYDDSSQCHQYTIIRNIHILRNFSHT